MLVKYCHFPVVDAYGRQVIHRLRPGDPDSLIKTAYPLLPKVAQFVEGMEDVDGEIPLLINALGASEFWGANINADIFFEPSM